MVSKAVAKRAIAALAVLLVWAGLVWFTAWDKSPAEWTPDLRFIVAAVGLVFAGMAAFCPLIED